VQLFTRQMQLISCGWINKNKIPMPIFKYYANEVDLWISKAGRFYTLKNRAEGCYLF
jgi:hypothetical protein